MTSIGFPLSTLVASMPMTHLSVNEGSLTKKENEIIHMEKKLLLLWMATTGWLWNKPELSAKTFFWYNWHSQ